MTTFASILAEANIDPKHVKLLRHKPERGDLYASWLEDRPEFEAYQSIQRRDRAVHFQRRYWASFIALKDGRTVFAGMYRPTQRKPVPSDMVTKFSRSSFSPDLYDQYDTEADPALSEYAGRIVVEWNSPRAWVQNGEGNHGVTLLDAPAVDTGPSSSRNPPWTRDELILALDLYIANPSTPGHTAPAVIELSNVLAELGRRTGSAPEGSFRNANGVYMKMMNFRRFDPAVAASGQSGLVRGNKDEEVVWKTFADDPQRLKAVANAIRSQVAAEVAPLRSVAFDDDFVEAPEGRLLSVVHWQRERSRKLVDTCKRKATASGAGLACEACGFDFAEVYGERGRGFIEAHHTKPVHTLGEGQTTKLEDLALVCSNCHRMIHSARPWLSIAELKEILTTRRTTE